MINLNLFYALPEIFILAVTLVILLVDAFSKTGRGVTLLTLIALVGAFILQGFCFRGKSEEAFNGMFILDTLAQGMKFITYITSMVIVVYIRSYLVDKKIALGQFYAIFLFAILGMLTMISANNMLILYVGLELLSLALYGLIAMNTHNVRATEAAMKFFILGALASGILLYGISFIYGATGGKLQLNEVFETIQQMFANGYSTMMLIFGIVFLVAGLAFKLGLVPFHMWIPDVYEGSQMPVVTIIATVTKIAALTFTIRFLIGGLVLASPSWSTMLEFLGILSLFVGNIVAIAQTNIKRMLGYSTISHMGFVAFGLMCVTVEGVSATIFYTIAYVITTLLAFGILTVLSYGNYECQSIDDLKGLSRTHPVYAGLMLAAMLSLAGIPPFIGFYAKFKILTAMVYTEHTAIAIYAVIMSLIGAFYYLRVIKVMYFDDKQNELTMPTIGLFHRSLLLANGFAIIAFGIFPNILMLFSLGLIGG